MGAASRRLKFEQVKEELPPAMSGQRHVSSSPLSIQLVDLFHVFCPFAHPYGYKNTGHAQ